jgi:hypothetical protein
LIILILLFAGRLRVHQPVKFSCQSQVTKYPKILVVAQGVFLAWLRSRLAGTRTVGNLILLRPNFLALDTDSALVPRARRDASNSLIRSDRFPANRHRRVVPGEWSSVRGQRIVTREHLCSTGHARRDWSHSFVYFALGNASGPRNGGRCSQRFYCFVLFIFH